MVHKEKKFVFVHIPKTGGHSIERYFGAWNDSGHKPHPTPLGASMLVGRNKEHFPLWKILKRAPEARSFFKFTFVRNPWDRMVSEWGYMQKHPVTGKARDAFWKYGKTFESFVKNDLIRFSRPGHMKPQYKFLDLRINFIGKFETLQEDWDLICDKIQEPKFKLPHTNKTDRKPYMEYYNDETRKIVKKQFAEDIKMFGYEFGK